MPVTVETLRSWGTKRVSLVTADGTIAGRIVQEQLSNEAVVALFDAESKDGERLVVLLDAIEEIVER